ncbi:MAG: tol-pal system YbgF family protein, partial [Blastopirellula sp. JB062]
SGVARQKDFATVGKAICLAEQGKPADGVKLIQPVLERANPKDADLFSAAYNALGRCYLKEGKPKDALLAFLHTDILFYGNPEMHAEALYYMSKLWKEVNDPDKGVAAYELLRSRYAGSRWASMN